MLNKTSMIVLASSLSLLYFPHANANRYDGYRASPEYI